MVNIGLITEIKNDIATIKIVRDSACGGNCSSCGGCELKNHEISANLKTDFDYVPNVGDTVNIVLDNKTFYLYTVAGYVIFVILLIVGGVIGYMKLKSDIGSFFGALVGLLAGFIIIKLTFKNKKSAYKIQKSEK